MKTLVDLSCLQLVRDVLCAGATFHLPVTCNSLLIRDLRRDNFWVLNSLTILSCFTLSCQPLPAQQLLALSLEQTRNAAWEEPCSHSVFLPRGGQGIRAGRCREWQTTGAASMTRFCAKRARNAHRHSYAARM